MKCEYYQGRICIQNTIFSFFSFHKKETTERDARRKETKVRKAKTPTASFQSTQISGILSVLFPNFYSNIKGQTTHKKTEPLIGFENIEESQYIRQHVIKEELMTRCSYCVLLY